MSARKQPTGASVSACLRRGGWHPVPDRLRQGLHVSGTARWRAQRRVHISMQWEGDLRNAREARDVAAYLIGQGYRVTRVSPDSVTVVGP
jgi:hypothetical protein